MKTPSVILLISLLTGCSGTINSVVDGSAKITTGVLGIPYADIDKHLGNNQIGAELKKSSVWTATSRYRKHRASNND